MMSAEQLERFKKMTPRERTGLMLDLLDLGWSIRRCQGPEAVAKSVRAAARIHLASVRALVEGLQCRGTNSSSAPRQTT
jgi:hypothetical protein